MNRSRWLLLLIAVLAIANIAWNIYSGWGLITIHAKDEPFSSIQRSLEKQGGVTIRSNIPRETKLSMDVEKVTLHEALETLSAISDSRWSLAYVFGGDRPTVTNGVAALANGERQEGWERAFYPLPNDYRDGPLPDPREDVWNVRPVTEKTAHSYLQQAAKSVSATFFYPTAWNPTVPSEPSSGKIPKAAASLADKAKASYQEVIFLTQRLEDDGPGGEFPPFGGGGQNPGNRRERRERPDGPRGDRPPGEGRGRGENRFAAMEERQRAEIAKLPADQQAAALKELEERKAFFEQLRDLPPDQRRAKMEEMADANPGMMNRMQNRMENRESRRTPQQQIDRARKYVDRKRQIKEGTN